MGKATVKGEEVTVLLMEVEEVEEMVEAAVVMQQEQGGKIPFIQPGSKNRLETLLRMAWRAR